MVFTVGILETGLTPPELIDEHNSYGNMFIKLLGAIDPTLKFKTYCVIEGEFPEFVYDCDGWVITGSRHGVYENLPWMQRLKDFLHDCQRCNKKIVGICFGHQILAEAMGGKVEKSTKGWGIGPHTYNLNEHVACIEGERDSFTINALHQDQVVFLPPSAAVLASSDFCEYAGLRYGDWAMSLQSHPEFSDAYEMALIHLRRESLFSDELADDALEKLSNTENINEGQRIASWMVSFLK
ncbi:GMP synthase [Dasania marina]|uniref:glutamine amidotransferase-related protein n=1 Tax=Dasania marina TaxID=471499 RepID=UPI0030D79033|tara:strand:- start:15212 stop:15928 length:717 start_codon:yes stop_codon:yes gene_type:complete